MEVQGQFPALLRAMIHPAGNAELFAGHQCISLCSWALTQARFCSFAWKAVVSYSSLPCLWSLVNWASTAAQSSCLLPSPPLPVICSCLDTQNLFYPPNLTFPFQHHAVQVAAMCRLINAIQPSNHPRDINLIKLVYPLASKKNTVGAMS